MNEAAKERATEYLNEIDDKYASEVLKILYAYAQKSKSK